MSQNLTPEDTLRVRQLIENSNLAEFVTHELSSKRFDAPINFDEGHAADIEISLQHRISDSDFGVRMTAKVTSDIGETTASISAEYVITDGYQPSKRDVLIFANEVGVMALFPFLREAVSTSTAKVFGNPLLLPTFERGAIAFDLEE